MTAPHFFVDPKSHHRLRAGDHLMLSERDSLHALRSRRLRPGEEVTISNDTSWVGRGRLTGEERGRAVVELDEVSPIGFPRHPEVDVSLGPPQRDRLAWAVQKLAELGVHGLKLMETQRSVRFPSGSALDRLAVVAREAAMQSSQPMTMNVGAWDRFGEAVVPIRGMAVMLHEGATDRLNAVLPDDVTWVHLLVGPEGGFSDSEIAEAQECGVRMASLGPSVLRTETAAVVGAALVLARYGRLG